MQQGANLDDYSVPNGTFRELEHDDQIHGRGNKLVTIPKGTQLNIPVWLLHTSKDLWGPTAEEFNPDREFLPQEVWNGLPLAGWNPQSHRYMPFTSAPRDCVSFFPLHFAPYLRLKLISS